MLPDRIKRQGKKEKEYIERLYECLLVESFLLQPDDSHLFLIGRFDRQVAVSKLLWRLWRQGHVKKNMLLVFSSCTAKQRTRKVQVQYMWILQLLTPLVFTGWSQMQSKMHCATFWHQIHHGTRDPKASVIHQVHQAQSSTNQRTDQHRILLSLWHHVNDS